MRGWGVGGRGETREEVLKRRKSEEVQKGSHRYLCAPLFILSGDKVALPTGVTGNWEVCWINHDEKSSPLLQRRLLRLQKRQLRCCRTSIPALKVMSGVSVWVSPPWPSTGIAPFLSPPPAFVSLLLSPFTLVRLLSVCFSSPCGTAVQIISASRFFSLFFFSFFEGTLQGEALLLLDSSQLSAFDPVREKTKKPSPSRLFLFAVPVRRSCSQASRWSEWERKKNPRMEGLYLVGGVKELTGDGWCVSADFTGWRLFLLWNWGTGTLLPVTVDHLPLSGGFLFLFEFGPPAGQRSPLWQGRNSASHLQLSAFSGLFPLTLHLCLPPSPPPLSSSGPKKRQNTSLTILPPRQKRRRCSHLCLNYIKKASFLLKANGKCEASDKEEEGEGGVSGKRSDEKTSDFWASHCQPFFWGD